MEQFTRKELFNLSNGGAVSLKDIAAGAIINVGRVQSVKRPVLDAETGELKSEKDLLYIENKDSGEIYATESTTVIRAMSDIITAYRQQCEEEGKVEPLKVQLTRSTSKNGRSFMNLTWV